MAETPPPSDPPTPDGDAPDSHAVGQWREVYEGCEAGLRAFLRGRLGQEVDVEDCLQAVCMKMLLQSQQEDDVLPAARRAWLFRVAANEAAAVWRRKASTQKMMDRHGVSRIRQADLTEQIILTETTAEVRRAVESLPEPMRQVVRLRMEESLTFQQIADQLEIPLGTALTRMRRALAIVKQALTEEDS